MTECTQETFEFAAHFSRRVVAEFSSDRLTTEGGSPRLRQVDRRIGLLRRFAACFLDRRDPSRIEHSVAEMIAQLGGLVYVERVALYDSKQRVAGSSPTAAPA